MLNLLNVLITQQLIMDNVKLKIKHVLKINKQQMDTHVKLEHLNQHVKNLQPKLIVKDIKVIQKYVFGH